MFEGLLRVPSLGHRYEKFSHFPQWYCWPTRTSREPWGSLCWVMILLCPAKKKGEKSNEMTDDHDHVLQFVLVTRCNGHCEDHTTKFLQWLPSADPWPHKPGNCIKKVHQEKLLPSSDSPPPFVWKPPGSCFLWQKETWAWSCLMARLILYLFKGP